MTSTSAMPAEMLVRIAYKNDATGAPIRITTGGATDGNVFVFTQNRTMTSNAGPTFNTEGAIDTNCYTREATESVNGASATLTDCPITGALQFLAEALKGYKPTYLAGGAFDSLGVESAATANCNRWVTAASTITTWTILELVAWRFSKTAQEQVRANIFRNVTEITPASQLQFGLDDPGAGTTDLNLVCKPAGAGWAASGLGALFPLFDDTGGVTATTDPITLGTPVGTAALYENLIELCAADNSVRGVPVTDALITANAALDTDLIKIP